MSSRNAGQKPQKILGQRGGGGEAGGAQFNYKKVRLLGISILDRMLEKKKKQRVRRKY